MISHGTLINHCGARPVTKGDLELIPAPPPTATWFPIRHLDVLDTVEQRIQEAGFTFRAMQLSVTADQKRFFGVLDLHSPIADGVCLSVGVRNSNDKTFPIGFCIGNRTFVCDNLAFSSQVVLSKRHTRFGEDHFREGIAAVIAKLNEYQSIEAQRIERLQHQELTDERADAVVLRAWIRALSVLASYVRCSISGGNQRFQISCPELLGRCSQLTRTFPRIGKSAIPTGPQLKPCSFKTCSLPNCNDLNRSPRLRALSVNHRIDRSTTPSAASISKRPLDFTQHI